MGIAIEAFSPGLWEPFKEAHYVKYRGQPLIQPATESH